MGRDQTFYNISGNARTVAPGSSPAQVCDVIDALKVKNPINGVRYTYSNNDYEIYGRCELAEALGRMSAIAKDFGIVELQHMGTYNCRVIGGTTTMSQHGAGNAIDIGAVKLADGTRYTVNNHFEAGVSNPQTPGGRLLYDFVHRLHDEKVFKIILTPNFNAAHRDHFHMDLTPNSDFLERHEESTLAEFDGVE